MVTVAQHLEHNRKELLDLTPRNRLLSIPKTSKSARLIHVVDEKSDQIYRILVEEKKAMRFMPVNDPADEAPSEDENDDGSFLPLDLPDSEQDVAEVEELPKRYLDSRLQTGLTPDGLKRRLLALHTDARTIQEEQGINILYLALGQLEWLEDDSGKGTRFAPLILVPVELSRESARDKFKVRWTEQEIQENLSLVTKLENDFGILMPEFEDQDEFIPSSYFTKVSNALKGRSGWRVLCDEITLGFFSFAKLMMFRDLQPENWPVDKRIDQNALVENLLVDGFSGESALFEESSNLDKIVSVERLDHVVDADGSQTAVVEIVRRGRNLVVQGPPGTGKSQTICNILAAAVLDKKRVLFIAEKLAALEVVKRRLEANGLGALCLELHSNKANKRTVLADLERTWKLGRPVMGNQTEVFSRLERLRERLNSHCTILHQVIEPCGLTPFRIIGSLVKLNRSECASPDLELREADRWTPKIVSEIRRNIEDLVERISLMGPPGSHVWRGVRRKHFLKIDADPLLRKVRNLSLHFDSLNDSIEALCEHLSESKPDSLKGSEGVLALADYVAKAPELDRQAICDTVWNTGLDELRAIISCGQRFEDISKGFGNNVNRDFWSKDLSGVRDKIAEHGKSFSRIFIPKYRAAFGELRACYTGPIPWSFNDRVALLDRLIWGQKLRAKIDTLGALGLSAFGSYWKREDSDWKQLNAILSWVDGQATIGLGPPFRKMFSLVPNKEHVGTAAIEVQKNATKFREVFADVSNELDLDLIAAFGVAEAESIRVAALRERLNDWANSVDQLADWVAYNSIANSLIATGAECILDALRDGQIQPNELLTVFDRTYFSQLLRAAVKVHPQLGTFDGLFHTRTVNEFRNVDQERVELSKLRTLLAHYEQLPSEGDGVGVTGVIKGEIARKRGHMPIRRLITQTGHAIQLIKPIFMMSPLSVAQYLAPGAIEFDLLVIDEASQVEPVDALGAVARCKQVVVVGDSKQLPPSRFFMRMTTESSEEEYEGEETGATAKDIESILGLCLARGIPQRMLRWHYRSRHHSLIATSNYEFYDNSLFIVPSPVPVSRELGLKFNYVTGGIFDSGNTAVNKLEAQTVAQAVMEHAARYPDETLGVAAFSIRQRQAIQDELEILRQERPDTEMFFNAHPHEPFFVKNLENVQGDERDVIFISIGYARDATGYMAMRFGPLSIDGGERRLNVLISRAKIRCEVFSSIRSEDVDLNRASGRGVAALKSFLRFAETGHIGVAKLTGKEEDSPFEEAVRSELEKHGLSIECQVGEAGFFIDLAVCDQDNKGSYILGIECDGAAYHSSRSARDRDRLRQAVLEDHGWIIHRIWSTDWFQRPDRELRNVLLAVEQAREKVRKGRDITRVPSDSNTQGNDVPRIESDAEEDLGAPRYVVTQLDLPPANIRLPKMAPGQLVRHVLKILEVEAPIHLDEIVIRIRSAWGYERAGNRIFDRVRLATRLAINHSSYAVEEGFIVNRTKPAIPRRRDESLPLSLRKPEYLPPSEIRAGIVAVIERHLGVKLEELPVAVARLFGFKATSAPLRSTIEAQIRTLLLGGVLTENEGVVQRVSSALPGTQQKHPASDK
jgi:very-short-patch-repair endonuclease